MLCATNRDTYAGNDAQKPGVSAGDVTDACGVGAYRVRCVRPGTHMALGALGADHQGVAWTRSKVGGPLVPSVRVFCGGNFGGGRQNR